VQPKIISSTSNATIKDVARLKRKRNRYEGRLFLAEGEDLLDAALTRGIIPRQVFVLEGHEHLLESVRKAARASGGRGEAALSLFICSDAALAKLSELGGGSRVVAVFALPEPAIPPDLTGGTGPLLYLSGTGDPGNVGTLIRSAASMGVSGVALAPGTADPFSPKSLRATMGAIFQLPVYLGVEPRDLISRAKAVALDIVCADPHQGEELWSVDLRGEFVLVLGAEREGVPEPLLEAAARTLFIPQAERTESLNVAMAGTVVLYEALRQRRTR